ncbi:hypothetical protein [Granulicoccus phenolivorans]|uniref:WXG100-like domain-containing protein n=1 Tax=Granulicoccus phenolivorans TaxID=266854 RepID=UPI000416AAE3|nr:hypothetical protein [Granulicoccus phenolivorans]
MSVMLPPELSRFLNLVGFEWPEGDEDRIFEWGNRWTQYGGEVDTTHATATQAFNTVAQVNRGPAVEAFKTSFTEPDGAHDVAQNLGVAGTVTGGCLLLIGGAVIALKIAFVINLVSFAIQVAAAIAAAIPTAGASMTLIPLARIAAQLAINFAINIAVEALLS